MGIIDKTLNAVASKFAAYRTLDVSTTTSDESNSAVASMLDAVYKPKSKKIDTYDYITYGNDDAMDKLINIIYGKSCTHQGILTKKAKMITGSNLIFKGEESLSKSDLVELKALKQRVGGFNKGFYEVFQEAAFLLAKDGGVGFLITYDVGFKNIISIKVVPHLEMRCGLPNSENVVENYIYRPGGFASSSSSIINVKEQQIPVFDVLNEKSLTQFLYVRNPLSVSPYYGYPTYLSAVNYISAAYDFEFSQKWLLS
jgi:hypothetical protein